MENATGNQAGTEEEETLKGRYLTFQIGEVTYGIEIRYVIEIVGLQPTTEMPEMPEYIKGIIRLRENIIPVMDIRLRFGMAPREYDDRTCIIVIDMNGLSVGLIIDSVSDVVSIGEEEIVQKPGMCTGQGGGYIKNIGKKDKQIILLVDSEKLLSKDDYSEISGQIA
jgi:purine-binding chemotaxis protein CheW